jgi:hypothetical protein
MKVEITFSTSGTTPLCTSTTPSGIGTSTLSNLSTSFQRYELTEVAFGLLYAWENSFKKELVNLSGNHFVRED